MWDSFAKIFAAWFGNPIRGLATIMMASVITILLWQYMPIREALEHPFLRWPTIALIFATTGLITYPISAGWSILQAKRNGARSAKKLISRLNDLTPHEQKVLQRYLEEQSTTQAWGRAGGAVDTLARDGVLHLIAVDTSTQYLTDLYAVDVIAWKYLNAHPELIDPERRP